MSVSIFGATDTTDVNVKGTLIPQSFTAIGGQTLFNLTGWAYVPGTNSLLVFVNGLRKVVNRDFLETSSTSFTLLVASTNGDKVDIIGFPEIDATSVPSGAVALGSGYSLAQYIQDSYINVKQYLAKGDGVTNDTATINSILATGKSIYLPDGTYVLDYLEYSAKNQRIRGNGKNTILKFTASATNCVRSKSFGTRLANTIPSTYTTGYHLRDLSIDINSCPNSSNTRAIAIEDTYDCVIENVDVLDSQDDYSNRWGLYFGRSIYTTHVTNCTIGLVAMIATNYSGSANFGTTIFFTNLNTWGVYSDYYQDVSFINCTVQKDKHKFNVGPSCGDWSIVACDIEGGGAFIYNRGGAANFYTAGNGFGGFSGSFFGGSIGIKAQDRPSGCYLDEGKTQSSRPIISITRSGTTATATVDRRLQGSPAIYHFDPPDVGDFVIISGCGAPFDAPTGVKVLTTNKTTGIFTFAVANTGATTGTNGAVVPDNTRSYRYHAMHNNGFIYDPLNDVIGFLKSVGFGTTNPQFPVDIAGAVQITGQLNMVGQATTGATTATFTATNKPGSAGGPAKWWLVVMDGVQGYIPIWPV